MVTKIKVIKSRKLKNPILIVGLPGVGLVGKITIDYLVKKLKPKCELYAKITSDFFPPAVHAKNGFLELISDEIYIYSYKGRDYLLLVGPVQPPLTNVLNSVEHYEFSESLSSFANKIGIKEIYTLAGLNIGQKRLNTKPRIIGVTTDKKTKKKIVNKKIDNLYFEKNDKHTLISGVAGLLPGISYNNYKIPSCCFMGETNYKLAFGDQGSAKMLLRVISKVLNLKIDMGEIEKDAKKIETSFNQISEKIKKISKKDNSYDVNYIR